MSFKNHWNISRPACRNPVHYSDVIMSALVKGVASVLCGCDYLLMPNYRCWFSSSLLTHWGRDKMADISQTIFSNVFSSMKMLEFRLQFHWSLFTDKGPINKIPALVQIMAWRRPGDKPLSEPMLVNLSTQICVTRPQWVNKMGSETITIIHYNDVIISSMAYQITAVLIVCSGVDQRKHQSSASLVFVRESTKG